MKTGWGPGRRKRATPESEAAYRQGIHGANYENATDPTELNAIDWAYRMGYDQGVGISMQDLGLGRLIHKTKYKQEIVQFRYGRKRTKGDEEFTLGELSAAVWCIKKKIREMEIREMEDKQSKG